ncbi:MAG TPA: hypothetical protein VFP68_10950 [Burkholderiaceae bacterium]|nr:hypothetical protein [Burkholderiaceae bacterium]
MSGARSLVTFDELEELSAEANRHPAFRSNSTSPIEHSRRFEAEEMNHLIACLKATQIASEADSNPDINEQIGANARRILDHLHDYREGIASPDMAEQIRKAGNDAQKIVENLLEAIKAEREKSDVCTEALMIAMNQADEDTPEIDLGAHGVRVIDYLSDYKTGQCAPEVRDAIVSAGDDPKQIVQNLLPLSKAGIRSPSEENRRA